MQRINRNHLCLIRPRCSPSSKWPLGLKLNSEVRKETKPVLQDTWALPNSTSSSYLHDSMNLWKWVRISMQTDSTQQWRHSVDHLASDQSAPPHTLGSHLRLAKKGKWEKQEQIAHLYKTWNRLQINRSALMHVCMHALCEHGWVDARVRVSVPRRGAWCWAGGGPGCSARPPAHSPWGRVGSAGRGSPGPSDGLGWIRAAVRTTVRRLCHSYYSTSASDHQACIGELLVKLPHWHSILQEMVELTLARDFFSFFSCE